MDEHGFTPSTVLARNTILNFAGMFLPLVVGVFSIPFAIRGLGKDGFGILSIAWVILGYLTLLDFGLSRATTKFTAENLKKNRTQAVSSILWTAVITSFCLGCLGSVVFYLFIPQLVKSLLNIPATYLDEAIKSFHLLAYGLPLFLISISLKGMLGAAQRFDLVNAVHIPVGVVSFIVPALSLPFGFGLSLILLFIVVSRTIAAFVYLFLCLKIYPSCRKKPHVNFGVLKKLISYGGWVTVTGVISPLLVYVDRFFIGSMLSMESLTYYSAPAEAITRLRILPMAIMVTLFPEFSRGGIDRADQKRVLMLFGKSFKIILITTGIISLVLLCYARDILNLWLGEVFVEKSAVVFKIFSVSILVNFLALVPFTFFQGIGRPDLPAKFHLVEFPLYVVWLWFLTKNLGINGAAIAWFLRVTVDTLLLFVWSRKHVPDLFRTIWTNNSWRVLLVLVLFGLFLFPIQFVDMSLSIKLGFLLMLLIIAAWGLWYFVLDVSEKKLIGSLLRIDR